MLSTNLSLIRRIGRPEDREAWNEFCQTYDCLVRGYVQRVTSAHGYRLSNDLDDIVQQVWINLLRSSGSLGFDPARARFRTFLYRVTSNAMADHFRRNRRHYLKRVGEATLDNLTRAADAEPAEWTTAYYQTIWNRACDSVRDQLLPVNPDKWRSFEESKIKHRKAKDVAAELGISEALVYQNSRRVFEEIRKLCLALYEEDPTHVA